MSTRTTPMLEQVLAAIRQRALLSRGDRVLAAVSGGADSVGMLLALREVAPVLGVRLTVAHLHHGIRGRAADADARFVRDLAARWKLPCVTGRADVPRLAKRKGLSLEMAAREARYDFLARAARRVRATVIATAHNADDQAETVLLKLARGAGPGGLGGIARSAVLHGLRVVRPMLDVGGAAIREFLRRRGIAWQEDETNRDLSILRNRVRHRVLPWLEKELNPGIREVLARTADVLREEDAWLEELARKRLAACKAGRAELRATVLRKQPPAALRRVVRLWLSLGGVPADRIDYGVVTRVEGLAAGKAGRGQTEIAGSWVVFRRNDRLRLEPRGVAAVRARPAPFRARVSIPGETVLARPGLRIVTGIKPGLVKDRTGRPGSLPAVATIRRSALGGRRLVVRSWRPGDRMSPLGMAGSRKLQDIFTDAKIPADERGAVPVFECGGQIIWIPGYRVARGWEVVDPRDAAVHIAVQPRRAPSIVRPARVMN